MRGLEVLSERLRAGGVCDVERVEFYLGEAAGGTEGLGLLELRVGLESGEGGFAAGGVAGCEVWYKS
jgi:hypothetical protein